MQRVPNNKFLFTDSSFLQTANEQTIGSAQTRFHQEIASALTKHFKKTESLLAFADQLLSVATHLCSFHQVKRLKAVSNCLLSLPLPAKYTLAGITTTHSV
jgi:hypothetical protein